MRSASEQLDTGHRRGSWDHGGSGGARALEPHCTVGGGTAEVPGEPLQIPGEQARRAQAHLLPAPKDTASRSWKIPSAVVTAETQTYCSSAQWATPEGRTLPWRQDPGRGGPDSQQGQTSEHTLRWGLGLPDKTLPHRAGCRSWQTPLGDLKA